MFSLLKKTFKTGLIAMLLVGGATAAAVAIAGPHRSKAIVHGIHSEVLSKIDASIQDPVALHSQLKEMEREYPARIAQVRGDLAELNEEIRQLVRDQEIAERVVELANADLSELQVKLAEAATQVEPASGRLAVVVRDSVMSVERASVRLTQIENTRLAYAGRAADADHDLKYLVQQKQRLEELMFQLETERAQFKTQLVGLSRQVDAIARNERLIDLLEKRNDTNEQCSRYEAVSLDQITGRLAAIKSRQEAELDLLSRDQQQENYEDLARLQIQTEGALPAAAAQETYHLSPYVAGE